MAETTHPDEATPVTPLSASRIEGRKKKKMSNPLCGESRREGDPAQRRPGELWPAFKPAFKNQRFPSLQIS